MPLTNDYEDSAFSIELKKIVDIDDEKLDQLLELLDSDEIMDLTDAVAKEDKERVNNIINLVNKFESDKEDEKIDTDSISSLFNKPKEEKKIDTDKKIDKTDRKDGKDTKEKDVVFSVGDEVTVGKEKGTIRIPDGPGNTVGVVIQGKVKMIDREKVQKLEESVIGFSNIPSVQRMKELAGLYSEEPSTTTAVIHIEDKVDPDEACCTANDALCALEAAIPNMRVSDLKDIRQRLNDLFAKMNG